MGGDKNKKITHLNSIRGTQRFTKPSQTNDNANVQINTEKAMPKLKKLAQDYIGETDPYGFLTNLRNALDIPNLEGASKYGVVNIQKEDGSKLEASLRITNHNSNAETYVTHNSNYEYNCTDNRTIHQLFESRMNLTVPAVFCQEDIESGDV